MRSEIITNIDNPGFLERLYRSDKKDFKKEFLEIYTQVKERPVAGFWYERLNYESDEISWGTKSEWVFVIFASLIAGILAKLPDIFTISEEFYYSRNISFLVFPFLTAYFCWKNNLTTKNIAIVTSIFLAGLIYINILPGSAETSDTLLLACIHTPLLLWMTFGLSFTADKIHDFGNRLRFLRFNGDLLVMSAILVLAGILMSGITLGLFNLIGMEIEEFYFRYIVLFGLPAIPIFATFLTHTNPQLVNKVSPVIAKIFSPLVLVMLIIYLGAIIYSGKDPYNDREFLLIFNLLLTGVIALIFFSVAESIKKGKLSSLWVLLPLSVVTIIVNAVALSAILFRISEWGFTPNRLAILGINILFLVHLIIIALRLFKILFKKSEVSIVEKAIAAYLPVYLVWICIVVFVFPFLFGFK
ncbi:hypothetical protein NE848_01280 [Gramella jeungdoensis]|uniref:DUF4153 domain-containing protein n=1 Tax=Gramella jeungdoensis TaxID=708091 RepID=A0ABT0YX11_9FLAO|nr:hypothetical protein [Gramella jeungdoensis]MCM8567996.1 hypothetical protein [Gramella jeungdoensis]